MLYKINAHVRVDSHLHHSIISSLQHGCPWSRGRQQQEDWKRHAFQTSLYPHIKCATQRLFLPQSICFGFSCEGAECCCMISPSNLPPSPTSQHTCRLWKWPTGIRSPGMVSKQSVNIIRKSFKSSLKQTHTEHQKMNLILNRSRDQEIQLGIWEWSSVGFS